MKRLSVPGNPVKMRNTNSGEEATARAKRRSAVEKEASRISDARRRVTALVAIARWLWVVNSVVTVLSVVRGRYDIAALAGFTWLLSLLVAAFGHRAAEYLTTVERAINAP
jgi:hypothetical protein